jgi:uncharacterized membrane protein
MYIQDLRDYYYYYHYLLYAGYLYIIIILLLLYHHSRHHPLSLLHRSLTASQNSTVLTCHSHRIYCGAKNILTLLHVLCTLLFALEYIG